MFGIVLEFQNNLWGLGTEVEQGCRTGPPGWRNRFLGINSWVPLVKSLKIPSLFLGRGEGYSFLFYSGATFKKTYLHFRLVGTEFHNKQAMCCKLFARLHQQAIKCKHAAPIVRFRGLFSCFSAPIHLCKIVSFTSIQVHFQGKPDGVCCALPIRLALPFHLAGGFRNVNMFLEDGIKGSW